MGVNATQVRGDSRTAELAGKNLINFPPIAIEDEEFSEANKVYIYNVSPIKHMLQHPLVGKMIIPACEPGEKYSKPAVIPGFVFYGVRTEMQEGEMRKESGRMVAIDLLGIGPYRNPANSLLRWGVFIAAQDTFDPNKTTEIRGGKNAFLSVPEWVKKGKIATKPTDAEIAKANEAFSKTDFELIAEADKFFNDGPKGAENITSQHRDAARRRGQLREWAKPIESLHDCPGCGDKVRPGVVVHSCGAVFDWDKAIALGIKKESERPTSKKPA